MDSRRQKLWLLVSLALGFVALAILFRQSFGLVVFLLLAAVSVLKLVRVAVGNARPGSAKQLGRALRDAFWGIG